MFHVDEPRLPGRTQVLVLDPEDLGLRRNPSIALPVDPDEDMALLEVRAVEVLRRVRTSAELEQNGYQVERLDGGACRRPLGSQLCNVDETKTRSRWSGVRMLAAAGLNLE